MKNLFCAALSGAIFLISCSSKETLTREEAIAALARFDDGWKNKSVALTDSILSPSYIYFTQSGGTFDRKDVIATAGSNQYTLQSVERKTIDVRIQGNTAVVNTTWIGKGMYFDKPFNDTQRCSVTLIKIDGEVKLMSEHCTPIQ